MVVSCLWGGIYPCIFVEGKKGASGGELKVQKQDLELVGEDVLFAFPLMSAHWALLEAKALRADRGPGWADIITATSINNEWRLFLLCTILIALFKRTVGKRPTYLSEGYF